MLQMSCENCNHCGTIPTRMIKVGIKSYPFFHCKGCDTWINWEGRKYRVCEYWSPKEIYEKDLVALSTEGGENV